MACIFESQQHARVIFLGSAAFEWYASVCVFDMMSPVIGIYAATNTTDMQMTTIKKKIWMLCPSPLF